MVCNSDTVGERLVDIRNNNTRYNGEDIYNKFFMSLQSRNEIDACAYYILFCRISREIIKDTEKYNSHNYNFFYTFSFARVFMHYV